MKKHLIGISISSCMVVLSQSAWAAAFVVRDIEVNGLERVEAGTVLSYLPVQVGQAFDDTKSATAARSLLGSGLFEDVKLGQRGDVLVVNVVERPAIGEINIKGNHKIPTDQIMSALKSAKLNKGDTLNQSALEQIDSELRNQYYSLGYYNADVATVIESLPRNRVAINITVKEGSVTRIQQVHIQGNQAFPESVLLKQLESGPRGALSIPFLSDRDKYSKEKLVGDLDNLTAFYRDRGYLHFQIVDTDVKASEDKKNVYLNITVNEGQQYRIGQVSVAGNPGLSQEQLAAAIKIKQGQVFSQKALEETRKNLTSKLGAQGYAFTKVKAVPAFDDVGRRGA